MVLGHQGGEATLPLLFSTIALAAGFQAGWLAGTLLLLAFGLPFAVWAYRVPRNPAQHDAHLGVPHAELRQWTRVEVMRDPLFWVLLTGVLAPPFIGTTIFYHQDYLTVLNGWPPQFFALSLSVMAATTVVFALVSGAIIDRFRASAMLPYFLLPLTVTCFALGVGGPPWTLFLVMVLLGTSYGFSSTLFGALWPEIYGTAHLGAVRSVIVSAIVLATAAGPGVTGTLIDLGMDLPGQMLVLSLYCLLGAAAMAFASLRLRQRATEAGGDRGIS